MNSRERLLTALDGGRPDRLPVTTHHLMPYFLETYLDGASEDEFFDRFGLDPIQWVWDVRPDESRGEYWSSDVEDSSPDGARWIVSDDWRIEPTQLSDQPDETRYDIITPQETLSMVLRRGPQTDWVVERPIKQKTQIELVERYAPVPLCDVEAINRQRKSSSNAGAASCAVLSPVSRSTGNRDAGRMRWNCSGSNR